MQILIIEDEKIAADKLERQLLQLYPNYKVVGKIDSVKKAREWLRKQQADLIFLDIHLSDGLSFSIFDDLEITTPIIFTTAYDAYALQAFKLNSIDYLLKPINKGDLELAIKKFEKFRPKNNPQHVQQLIDILQGKKQQYQERFMVHSGEKIKSIAIEQAAYFFAEGKYVFLVTQKNEQYIIDFTLDKLIHKLNPSDYFRINRKFIIHIDAIKQMFPYSKGRLKIELSPLAEQEVIVSIERSADFKQWLNQ